MGKATTALFEGLISKVTGQSGSGIDFGYIGQIVIVLLVLYIISTVFSLIQGFAMSGIAQKVSYKMRKEILILKPMERYYQELLMMLIQ